MPETSNYCSLSQTSCGSVLTKFVNAAPAPSATMMAGRTQRLTTGMNPENRGLSTGPTGTMPRIESLARVTTDPNPDIAVRCRGLTKHYGSGDGSVAALRGVDLDVRIGELLMLVGPSGCGKTTLISIITAILDQDDGQCEVFGHDVQRIPEAERARFRGEAIALVFQAFNLLPALSALENVSVPLLLKGISREESEERARDVLEAVGLGAKVDTRPPKSRRISMRSCFALEQPMSLSSRTSGCKFTRAISRRSNDASEMLGQTTCFSNTFNSSQTMKEVARKSVGKVKT